MGQYLGALPLPPSLLLGGCIHPLLGITLYVSRSCLLSCQSTWPGYPQRRGIVLGIVVHQVSTQCFSLAMQRRLNMFNRRLHNILPRPLLLFTHAQRISPSVSLTDLVASYTYSDCYSFVRQLAPNIIILPLPFILPSFPHNLHLYSSYRREVKLGQPIPGSFATHPSLLLGGGGGNACMPYYTLSVLVIFFGAVLCMSGAE